MLSVRRNRINLPHLHVFNIAKTAENAVFAVKSRIVRKLGMEFQFGPGIQNVRKYVDQGASWVFGSL